MKKCLVSILATAALSSLAVLGGAPAAHAEAVEVVIRPAALDRGPDVHGSHLDGNTIVDGDQTLKVRGGQPILLGESAEGAYVVQSLTPNGARWRVQSLHVGEPPRVLVRDADPGSVVLADNGSALAVETSQTRARTEVVVLSTATGSGSEVGSQTFDGVADVLDFRGHRIVVGGSTIGGDVWNLAKDRVRRLSFQQVYEADLAADRVASYDSDPSEGGCSWVSRASAAMAKPLSISCTDRVAAFSPDGARMATIDIRSDGIGPDAVVERKVGGKRILAYSTGLYFGSIGWEDDHTLLLDAYGPNKGATVRCDGTICERASDLVMTPVS